MEKNPSLNLRAFALATLVPVTMMIVAMWMKPLWRDEYFTQYFADPDQSLSWLLPNRWASDPHPPAYNPLLWMWSHMSVHPFWQKCLSLVILGLGALAALKITPRDQRQRLYVFFLICLGSYWVIYFATEIRPYILNFTLSALLTIITVRLSESDNPKTGLLFVWLVIGILLSLTHYFGALWFASLGCVLGVTKLVIGDKKQFIIIGMISLIGLIPLLLWLNYSFSQIALDSVTQDNPPLDRLVAGGHQFLRGLTLKTFLSNPMITFLGIGATWTALKGGQKNDALLLRASLLTVFIAFFIHVFLVDMIKERAFIVIMPALLWIMAGRVAETQHRWARFLPLVTAIMPFLFVTEYFKTKEKIPELLQAMGPYQAQCQSEPLAIYYRTKPYKNKDIFRWSSEKVFSDFGENRVDLAAATHLADSNCPVLAVAILLPKNDKAMIEESTGYILKSGYKLDEIELIKFGKGRSLLWIKK